MTVHEEQIIAILCGQEAGAKTANVCGKHGISGARFGGLDVSDARRLKILEAENAKLTSVRYRSRKPDDGAIRG